MKLITVRFDDSKDVTVLPKETTGITVTNGTVSVADGTILALCDVEDTPAPEDLQPAIDALTARIDNLKLPVVGQAGPPAP